jgi:hypothetical protein
MGSFLYFTRAFRKQAAIDVAEDEHLQKRQQVADDPTDGLYSTTHLPYVPQLTARQSHNLSELAKAAGCPFDHPLQQKPRASVAGALNRATNMVGSWLPRFLQVRRRQPSAQTVFADSQHRTIMLQPHIGALLADPALLHRQLHLMHTASCSQPTTSASTAVLSPCS